jgi:SAM-dependent methyltransferase
VSGGIPGGDAPDDRRREARGFERANPIHETRDAKGWFNRLRPPAWLAHNDEMVQLRTREMLAPYLPTLQRPKVLVVGVGGGGVYYWMWREPEITRLGVDVNHEVMRLAVEREGAAFFHPVEADAPQLPFPDASLDVVFFDFVLHHVAGQGVLERAVADAFRVAKPGGLVVAREPSSYSLSGALLNLANWFRLMNALSGASNYEFALSPPFLMRVFESRGAVLTVRGLTYFWAHRLPVWVQDVLARLARVLLVHRKLEWAADFLIYVVRCPG